MTFPAGRSELCEPTTAAVSAQTSVPPEHSAHLRAEHARADIGLACLQVLRQAKQLQKDRERLKAQLAALAADGA